MVKDFPGNYSEYRAFVAQQAREKEAPKNRGVNGFSVFRRGAVLIERLAHIAVDVRDAPDTVKPQDKSNRVDASTGEATDDEPKMKDLDR